MMQKRVYLGTFKGSILVDVQAVPVHQSKARSGTKISRKTYRKFLNNNPAKPALEKAA